MSDQSIHTMNTLIWVEKKLDDHAESIGLWDMRVLVLEEALRSGTATTEQKREWDDMVTERRAIMIINGLMKQADHEMKAETT